MHYLSIPYSWFFSLDSMTKATWVIAFAGIAGLVATFANVYNSFIETSPVSLPHTAYEKEPFLKAWVDCVYRGTRADKRYSYRQNYRFDCRALEFVAENTLAD